MLCDHLQDILVYIVTIILLESILVTIIISKYHYLKTIIKIMCDCTKGPFRNYQWSWMILVPPQKGMKVRQGGEIPRFCQNIVCGHATANTTIVATNKLHSSLLYRSLATTTTTPNHHHHHHHSMENVIYSWRDGIIYSWRNIIQVKSMENDNKLYRNS